MRSHRITIAFPDARKDRLFHQIGNLAEDIETALHEERGARIENPYRYPEGRLYIHVVSDGKLPGTLKTIQACLEKHLLDHRGIVTVVHGVES